MKNPFPIPSHEIEPFPPKIFFLETCIESETLENLGACIAMVSSSNFRGFHLNKGMLILHN